MNIKKVLARWAGAGIGLLMPLLTYAQLGGFGDESRPSINPNVPGSSQFKGEDLLVVIQQGVNYVLALLAFIALLVLLWGGFQMVTAAGDDNKYQNWFKILKQAGMGLILIGVSWFIISVVFYVIDFATRFGW